MTKNQSGFHCGWAREAKIEAPVGIVSSQIMFRLEPRASELPVIRVPDCGRVKIGRSPSNDVVWDFTFVSRRHAEIYGEDSKAYLVPLTNALVTLNEMPLMPDTRHELSQGDLVAFVRGKVEFLFEVCQRKTGGAKHGASSLATSSALKKRKVQQQQRVEDLECPICNGLLAAARATPCGHVACAECLKACLARNRECPECRTPIKRGTDLYPVFLLDNLVEAYSRREDADPAEVQDYKKRLNDNKKKRVSFSDGQRPNTADDTRSRPSSRRGENLRAIFRRQRSPNSTTRRRPDVINLVDDAAEDSSRHAIDLTA